MPPIPRSVPPAPRWLLSAFLALALTAALTACGGGSSSGSADTISPGDIPDTQVFVPYSYSAPPVGFSVKIPEGWSRSQSGAAVLFTDNFNSIRLETSPVSTAPTVESATSKDLPAIIATGRNVTQAKVTAEKRSAGDVIRIRYEVDSEPDSVTGKSTRLAVERYQYWQKGTQAVVTLSGAVGSDNVDPWRIVTDSFGWQ